MKERIDYLLNRFCSNAISIAEKEELLQLLARAENEVLIKQSIENMWNNWEEVPLLSKEQSDTLYNNILAEILRYKDQEIIPRSKIVHYKKWMVAAGFLLVLFAGTVWVVNRKSNVRGQSINQDIKAPNNSFATITLSDGKRVSLNDINSQNLLHNGELANVTVNGTTVQYKNENTNTQSINVLTNPMGSKTVTIVLSDGTKVWLNAGSSLRYPVCFNDKERTVAITGEAYFEVTHKLNTATKSAVPFIVQLADKRKIEVLGTQFNVNAYNENEVKTTLVEGKVQVGYSSANLSNQSKVIHPGEQAIQSAGGNITTANNINIDAVLAWKNDYFYFAGDDIQSIMAVLSRWYNVQIIYQDHIPYTFVAKISRDENISSILKIFELTNLIEFKINGNKITVMQPTK